jgi:hypothetical protein
LDYPDPQMMMFFLIKIRQPKDVAPDMN